ncbi:MshP protein [Photobacterium sp.]|uniref:MshP protein n=1 Tax=Photobacterium sp. TaxID=660 RepID=UPI00299D0CD1|nr:MshP protein [Photobacterium sp.]MDX1303799.1 MshP protein [Photobacterium sp.]
MYYKRSYNPPYKKQQGSALMVSIFVIVVMSVMAAAMTRIGWSSQDITTKEVLGTRAWFTAHSGNEVMLSRLFPIGQSSAKPTACVDEYKFKPANSYGCTAIVNCTDISVSHAGSTIRQFYLESSATCAAKSQVEVTRVQESWAKELL